MTLFRCCSFFLLFSWYLHDTMLLCCWKATCSYINLKYKNICGGINNMKYNAKAIGQRIKNERQTLSLTQGDFAKNRIIWGISATIGKWENGKLLPQFEDMLKMCEVFDCELGYLLGEFDCKNQRGHGYSSKNWTVWKSYKKIVKNKSGYQQPWYFNLAG